jgi:hypothetical protein
VARSGLFYVRCDEWRGHRPAWSALRLNFKP